MEKISYKNRFILLVIFLFIIATAILYNFLTSISSSNVGDISVKNFKAKAFERENFINHFFAPYISTIKSIKNDKNFTNYLSGELDKEYIENYFLSIKNSLPSLYQVRYLDNNAKEIIKIDGTSSDIYGNNAISNIVSKKNLEIKSYRDYIKEFLSLNDEIGFSYIDLNIENNRVVIPKQPTLRIGTPVFNKNGIKKGFVILNISLKVFFERLNNSTLYNIYLIDKEGKFLNHNQSTKYGLLGENMHYSIKDEFTQEYNAIFANDEYYGNTFYSKKLKNFNSNQNVKLILSLKYSNEFNYRKKKEEDLIIYFIIFILISLVTISYFSSLPDKLREEISNNKYANTLTKLPNRLSLIKDLSQGEFKNSVVILIAINNLIKIQNSYGQRTSDQLVKKIGKFLSNFKNKSIEKVYVNSYNVFTLKYHYTNDIELKGFLNNLLSNIENEAFIINKKELEFYLDVTIGVSDPHKLNNNIEELNEAENALDNALNKDLHLDIFNIYHKNDTEKQKENINLAKQIKKALENDGVILHYQPILNNLTNSVEKYESLIRMSVNDSLIFPDTFLPISKQIKKYNYLSKKVIDKSFEFFKDKNIEFSINLSPKFKS